MNHKPRKRGQPPEYLEKAIELKRQGKTLSEIAQELNVSRNAVTRALAKYAPRELQRPNRRKCVQCHKMFTTNYSNKFCPRCRCIPRKRKVPCQCGRMKDPTAKTCRVCYRSQAAKSKNMRIRVWKKMYVNGMTCAEIAKVFGCTPHYVRCSIMPRKTGIKKIQYIHYLKAKIRQIQEEIRQHREQTEGQDNATDQDNSGHNGQNND